MRSSRSARGLTSPTRSDEMYFHQQVRPLLFFPLARLSFRSVLFNLTAESFSQKLRSQRKSWSFCLFSSPRPVNTLLSWAPLPEMHYSQQHRVIYEAAHKACRIPTPCAPTRCCLSEEDAAVSAQFLGNAEEKNAWVGQPFLHT